MNRISFLQRVSLDDTSYLKRAFALLAIWLLVGAVISFPRVTHPAFGFQGDLPLHYHITRAFARSFDEGDLAPRWAGLLDGGKGNAWFTFYPPLAYLFSAAMMKLLGVDVLTSLRIVSFLIFLIAQASAYLFARALFNRRYSLIASLFYAALPAFPLVGLKVGLFLNAFALSLAPLAMLGAHELLIGERRARGLIIFALGASGIILSHVITTYLCGIAIALMTLIYLPKVGWRGAARLAGAGLLALALTAFFLVPQLIEMKWAQVDQQVARHDYRNYLLFAKPLDECPPMKKSELTYPTQPCQPTRSKETAARSKAPVAKPIKAEKRRVITSIGKVSRSKTGLYEQSANAAPLSVCRFRRSQLIASAKQKNPNADVCPPARHSTRNGMNERARSNDIG